MVTAMALSLVYFSQQLIHIAARQGQRLRSHVRYHNENRAPQRPYKTGPRFRMPRTVVALILREMATTYGRSAGAMSGRFSNRSWAWRCCRWFSAWRWRIRAGDELPAVLCDRVPALHDVQRRDQQGRDIDPVLASVSGLSQRDLHRHDDRARGNERADAHGGHRYRDRRYFRYLSIACSRQPDP